MSNLKLKIESDVKESEVNTTSSDLPFKRQKLEDGNETEFTTENFKPDDDEVLNAIDVNLANQQLKYWIKVLKCNIKFHD